jgi:hypothetical protein
MAEMKLLSKAMDIEKSIEDRQLELAKDIHSALCKYFAEDTEKDIMYKDMSLINEPFGWQTFSISFTANRVNFLTQLESQ